MQIMDFFIGLTLNVMSLGAIAASIGLIIDDAIVIREMLNMTILLDHDVIDGAPMARFISDLVKNIESGNSIGV